MELVVYLNKNIEEEKALFDLDSGEVLLNGDEYHYGITDKIAGYLEALRHFDIYTKETKYEWVNERDEKFKILGFHCE